MLDQVLMGNLGESPALIGIEVDVVNEQRARGQGWDGHVGHGGGGGGSAGPVAVLGVVELKVNLDLVVLQSNQWQSQAWVAVPEELQGNVQDITGNGGRAGSWGGQVWGVANHGSIAQLVASGLGQLVPNVDPVTVVLVNALATNLKLNGLDQGVANPVEPTEGGARWDGNIWQLHAQVCAVDQITVTADGSGDLLGPITQAVEGLFNGLQGEVGVSAVDNLEESNLRITGQVNILLLSHAFVMSLEYTL